ncbi:hypothetical protein HS088_TW16G00129 [Tripterygium wilfordii]|uniref:DUF4219 domain-containing protein n=1 Tax=Tripterygium wilfordii TaxID=458696 RepID=A0A7J7CI27_TRIWF|nr:hypothetical protein HS088_TW16G00129 [Tripterygium wilfordii]
MATNIAPTAIVNELLRKENYATWRASIKNYLLAQDLWDVVESPTNPLEHEQDEAYFKRWRKKNAAALHAIKVSCNPEMLGHIKDLKLANSAWDTLADLEAQHQRFCQFLHLSKAIDKGDLNAVKDIIRSNPYVKHARNPNNGMTALHLAIYAGHGEIAEQETWKCWIHPVLLTCHNIRYCFVSSPALPEIGPCFKHSRAQHYAHFVPHSFCILQ